MTCFNKKEATAIRFNHVQLESIDSHKHLGLVLSRGLSWLNHIDSILQAVCPIVKYDLDKGWSILG